VCTCDSDKTASGNPTPTGTKTGDGSSVVLQASSLSHSTPTVTPSSLTTAYQKFTSFAHGKPGSSSGSQDGIRMSPRGFGRALSALASNVSPSSKISSPPSPTTIRSSTRLCWSCAPHTRDARKIGFYCFPCLLCSHFSVFPCFCTSYCRHVLCLTDSTLVLVHEL
jgi:hypothetical protein